MSDGSVAVITGGAGGIGAATADRLAADGYSVAVADLEPPGASAHLGIATDVSDEESVAACFDRVEATLGPADVLVNNASIAHGSRAEAHFFDTDPEMWDDLMAVNLRGLFLCTRRAARGMAERGWGTVVNVSSAGATRAHRNRVAYDASKGAIEAATRSLALDLAPTGIRVNAVAPGAIAVPNRTSVGDETAHPPADVIPLGRTGSAGDVAGVIAFLCSDDAAYLTGVTIPIDGGVLAQLRSPGVDVRPGAR